MNMINKGLVIRLIAGEYKVYDLNTKQIVSAKPRGVMRIKSSAPKVGDYVDYNLIDEKNAIIEKIHERRNDLIRPYISNIDQAFVIFSVKEPELNKWIYHFYEISMLINQKKYDEAKSLFEIFKIRYSKKIYEYYRNTLELTLLIEINNEEIVDFEKLNFNNKANNLNNLMAYTRAMKYYDTRGKKELAVKYALLIKEANVGFKEIDEIVEKVLNQEN